LAPFSSPWQRTVPGPSTSIEEPGERHSPSV
jgi:hypothetical protein